MTWIESAMALPAALPEVYETAVSNTTDWLAPHPSVSDPATAPGGSPLLDAQPDSWWGQVGQTVGDLGRGVAQETTMGLLDERGMLDVGGLLDRQTAQRELSDRFQVVPEEAVGPLAPNQVTQEEYEQIAGTFSGVRRGTGDLSLDGSALGAETDPNRQAWEGGIQANIADMMMTDTGRGQIEALSDSEYRDDDGNVAVGGSTTIAPYFDAKGAYSMAGAGVDAATADQFDAAFRSYDGERGIATDAMVNINPGEIRGLRSDVALAHELRHAQDMTEGSLAAGIFVGEGPDSATQFNAERAAVGLRRSDSPDGGSYIGDASGNENGYRQERNELGDRFLPRTNYSTLPGEAPASMSPEDLAGAWDAHQTSVDVEPTAAPVTSLRPQARPAAAEPAEAEPTLRPKARPTP